MKSNGIFLCMLAFFLLCTTHAKAAACAGNNGGLTLPPGFCATVFADSLGRTRHLTVAPNGVVYANSWSSQSLAKQNPDAHFLIALEDSNKDGKADVITYFGPGLKDGSEGGTGIAYYHGAIFVEVNGRIDRYALAKDQIVPVSKPDVIVSGLPIDGDHDMHPFVINEKGQMFIDVASASNSCQKENRVALSPGVNPCIELNTRGGLWLYDANKTGQKFSPNERYVTGLRNSEGLAFDAKGRLFATQHGRDQLFQNWPSLYTAYLGAELPGEIVVQVEKGGDYGWPYCYFDPFKKTNILAPEYGGDGKKIGLCKAKRKPLAAFPGHWAPNDMLLYSGKQFPKDYQGGLFIAFHGSWNRAPSPQGGYNIVFQPLKNGKPSGSYSIFADGFAGEFKEPGRAAFRPTGLAVAPDGALFISDDKHGRIWRVTYEGTNATRPTQSAQPPNPAPKQESAALQPPPGYTKEQLEQGSAIYHNSACIGCHGSDAKGSPVGSDLTSKEMLWSDGSLQSIITIIKEGIAKPKAHAGVMPPMGGASLTQAQLDAVGAYIWALRNGSKQ